MRRLIYASQAVHDMGPDELVAVLEASRANNAGDGLSGMLIYSGQSFLQMLEGEDDAVQRAYDRIAADPRHRDLRVIGDLQVPGRLFGDWTMGFEHIDDEDLAEELDGYAPTLDYPLVNADLVRDAATAQRLLSLYAGNRR
jgi:hypothetical protein